MKWPTLVFLSPGQAGSSGDQNSGPEDAVGDADVVAPLQEGLELPAPADQRHHVAPGTTEHALLSTDYQLLIVQSWAEVKELRRIQIQRSFLLYFFKVATIMVDLLFIEQTFHLC